MSERGVFRLLSRNRFLSNSLEGEIIGIEEVGDALWNIVCYNTILGRIDLQTSRITEFDHV